MNSTTTAASSKTTGPSRNPSMLATGYIGNSSIGAQPSAPI